HRREGLSFRLYNKIRKNEWVPSKRVLPSNDIPLERKGIYITREETRDASHSLFKVAKEKGDFSFFTNGMKPFVKKLDHMPLKKRFTLYMKKYLKFISDK